MASSAPHRARTQQKLYKGEKWVVGLTALLIVIANLPLGGGNNAFALLISCFYGLSALAIAIFSPPSKPALAGRQLIVPAALLIVTVFSAILSIVPNNLVPVQNLWRLVGGLSTTSTDRPRTIIEIIKLCSLGCIFLVGFNLSKSSKRSHFLIKATSILVAIYGIIAFFSYILAPTTIMGLGEKDIFQDRLTASFLSPNTAGTFFGLALSLCLSWTVQEFKSALVQGQKSMIGQLFTTLSIPGSATLICLTDLILTGSRSGALATGFAILCYIFALGSVNKWGARGVLILVSSFLAMIMVAGLFISGTFLIQRMMTIKEDAWSRTDIYSAHFTEIKDHILFGDGLGTFEPVNREIANPQNYRSLWTVRAMHNVYMQWLEAGGLFGFLPMFLLILFVLFAVGLSIRSGARSKHIGLMTILASTIVLLHGFTDFALENLSIAGLWAILLGIGFGNIRPSEASAKLPLSPVEG
jgi:O-antigen ligase